MKLRIWNIVLKILTVNIMRKSEKAKLTTKRFDGVRSDFVEVKTLITT
jgi:hypothetical protein